MATRLLLTLLALLTGLATQLAPAQARGGAAVDVEIGATATAVASTRQSASQSFAHERTTGLDGRVEDCPAPLAPRPSVPVLTVLQGIDRARE